MIKLAKIGETHKGNNKKSGQRKRLCVPKGRVIVYWAPITVPGQGDSGRAR